MRILGFIALLGLVTLYFWQILTVIVLVAAVVYGRRHLIVRAAARAELAHRADTQHAQSLQGDERGVYGIYEPAPI